MRPLHAASASTYPRLGPSMSSAWMMSRCAAENRGMTGSQGQPGAVDVFGDPNVGRCHDQDLTDRVGADAQGGLDLNLVTDGEQIEFVERAAVCRPMPADHGVARLTGQWRARHVARTRLERGPVDALEDHRVEGDPVDDQAGKRLADRYLRLDDQFR